MTTIGSHCFMMVGSHVAHDCIVGDHVILTNNALCGGHAEVGDYAIVGGGAAVQQRIRIGAHCFIGGLTGVDRDVLPYAMANGQRPVISGINVRGLKRRGFGHADLMALRGAFRLFFSNHAPAGRAHRRGCRGLWRGGGRQAPGRFLCRPAATGRWRCRAGQGWASDDDLDA